MAVSGTISTTNFNTQRVIDHAFRRCKLLPQQITSEMQQQALDLLYLFLSALQNRKTSLWCIEKVIVPIYWGQAIVPMPIGTIDIREANHRTIPRLEGTYTSSAGGSVDLAFDGDFDTACTQVSTNGNISIELDSATTVTTVGILPDVTASWTLVFERSDDGITWVEALAPGAATYTDDQWIWYDIDGAVPATFFRVRMTGGGTLALREFFIGSVPNELPLARLNVDDYTTLPNKTFQGSPITQYWFDRQRDTPQMYVWPVPNEGARFYQLVVWRKRYIMDVGQLTDNLDIPQRWYDAIVWRLAYNLAVEIPEVPDSRIPTIQSNAEITLREAEEEERDNSPIYFTADIGVYTR